MFMYIYSLIDPRDDRIRYIGKTKNIKNRLYQHIHGAKSGKITKKYCWIRKLLKLNLEPKIQILEKVNTLNWKQREIYWINYYGLNNLTNLVEGGGEPPNTKGTKHSNETKMKISLALKGKKKQYTNAWKGKKGKLHPAYGRKHTEEEKNKIRFSKLGSKNPRYGVKDPQWLIDKRAESIKIKVEQLDLEGNLIKIWDSMKQATESLALPAGAVNKVCRGKRKTTKGFKFKYH